MSRQLGSGLPHHRPPGIEVDVEPFKEQLYSSFLRNIQESSGCLGNTNYKTNATRASKRATAFFRH